MSKKKVEFSIEPFYAADPENDGDVHQLIRWTSNEGMIPLNEASIARHALATAAYAKNQPVYGARQLAGYAAITQIYDRHIIEVGGLVVSPLYRRYGLASRLVSKVVERALSEISPEQILAFSNPDSAKLFEKLGGTQIEDATTLPNSVWKLCLSCRFYDEKVINEGQKCCGRVFDITEIGSKS